MIMIMTLMNYADDDDNDNEDEDDFSELPSALLSIHASEIYSWKIVLLILVKSTFGNGWTKSFAKARLQPSKAIVRIPSGN